MLYIEYAIGYMIGISNYGLASPSESYTPDTCTHIQACTHIHMQACTHTACTHTRTHTHVCMHAHTQARTYMHTHTCNHAWMHARTHARTHAHTCMYVHSHMHIPSMHTHHKDFIYWSSQATKRVWRSISHKRAPVNGGMFVRLQPAHITQHTSYFKLGLGKALQEQEEVDRLTVV